MPSSVDTPQQRPHQSPFLLIVGCPRSGTTLLQRMVDAHPMLAVANDTHFIPRVIEKSMPHGFPDGTDPAAIPLTPELVEATCAYHRFPRLGLTDAQINLAAADATTYNQFVSRLYASFARMHDKPLGGEKTPDFVRKLPLLHALMPWVRSVHIIRDGRDVALSTLQWANQNKGPGKLALWQDEPTAVCALWWRWQVGTGRRDAAGLDPDRYMEVLYEDLIHDPAQTLSVLTDFLDLPFDEHMLNFNQGKQKPADGLSAKKAWLGPTPGLRDWRTQMDDRSVELFEALAGDLLDELGYERRYTDISDNILRIANRCRDWWDDHMEQKQDAQAVLQTIPTPSSVKETTPCY